MENALKKRGSLQIRKENMLFRWSCNTCYLRAGGELWKTKIQPIADKSSDDNKNNPNSDDNDDIGIENLKPSDFKVLEQVGFLEVQLRRA